MLIRSLTVFLSVTTFFLSVATGIVACAPGLGGTIPVSLTDSAARTGNHEDRFLDDKGSDYSSEFPTVRLQSFTDVRRYSEIVSIRGRSVMPAGNIPLAVRDAFQSNLRKLDYRVTQFEGPIVAGEVLEWRATVDPGFPTTKCEALAALRVFVTDENHNVIFQGIYNGASKKVHPFLGQSGVQETIAGAMDAAIAASFEDNGLLQALRSHD